MIPNNPKDRDTMDKLSGVPAVQVNAERRSPQSRDRLYWTSVPPPAGPNLDLLLCLNDILEGGGECKQGKAWRKSHCLMASKHNGNTVSRRQQLASKGAKHELTLLECCALQGVPYAMLQASARASTPKPWRP